MFSEVAVAIVNPQGISALSQTTHPFSTQAEASRNTASGLASVLSKKSQTAEKRKAS
ncbi:MAG: hypothetical protein JSS10_09535 [Verrucomicrobia bacterium]|nr:hypothetical protein [Verrucomicrobiota bacterium]